ncbi:HEAT repeat domain-containing protein [Kitasatospora sp. NPDC058162]|uniref:HEAT repeat domain-containing protein n=1 Tax=Kitasatospora sp. NPDC058162 TaxID=3346362 RepID=UPI0036DD46CD
MDLADALAGLDAHPWASLAHAYGSAEDLPGLLRAFVEAGEDGDAEEARDELYSAILHQGTVYSASVDAVPFLARIAAAGHQVVEILWMLGGLAETDDEWQIPEGAVRAAVAGQLPLLMPLLADGDADVRGIAASVVGRTRDTGTALPALRGRWAVEPDAVVRAELLLAIGRSAPAEAADLARALLDDTTPRPLRLAAVLATVKAGAPWSEAQHAAALAVLPTRELTVDRYSMHHQELLPELVTDLLARGTEADRESAFALVEAALRDERPGVPFEALWAAYEACDHSRSAPRRLVPAVARHAAHDYAERLLTKLGPLGAAAAPALAALAEQSEDKAADRALAVLVRVAPRQAAPLLARDLARRPRALAAAGGFRAPEFPFDPALVAAVRERLLADDLRSGETAELVHLLCQWGPQAAAGLPELYAVLPYTPYAATAVAAVAADSPQAERRQAAAVLRAAAGRLIAARAHHRLTGETGLLLAAAAEGLTVPKDLTEAARAAADLGPAAVGLLPALRAAVSQDAEPTAPQLEADIAIATALQRIDGDAEAALRILESVLDRCGEQTWFRWTVLRAVQAAALLGPAARPLVPRLAGLLGDPEQAPTAVLALLRIADPDTLDRGRLAEAALDAVDAGFDPGCACEALHALGSAALSSAQRRRIAELVGSDRRIPCHGHLESAVLEDERLRVLLAGL